MTTVTHPDAQLPPDWRSLSRVEKAQAALDLQRHIQDSIERHNRMVVDILHESVCEPMSAEIVPFPKRAAR